MAARMRVHSRLAHSAALKVGVLRLQPCPRPPTHIGRAESLRHIPLQFHAAGVAEHGLALGLDCFAKHNTAADRPELLCPSASIVAALVAFYGPVGLVPYVLPVAISRTS